MNIFNLKKTIDEFTSARLAKSSRVEQLRREREDVVALPAAPSDTKKYFHTIIEQRGQEYIQAVAQHLAPMKPESLQNHQHTRQFGNLLAISAVGGGATPRTIDAALCCLLGPTLRQAIDSVIDSMPTPAGAITLAERAARLKRIDAELDELLAEERELVAAGRAAGLAIGPGPHDGEKTYGGR